MGKLLIAHRPAGFSMVVVTVLVALLGFVLLVPLLSMLAGSFMSPVDYLNSPLSFSLDRFYAGNYESIFRDKYFFSHWYLNSIIVVAAVIVLRLLITVSAAYAFAKLRFPFKNGLFVMVMGVLMIPSDTTLIGRFLVYKSLGIIDSHLAIILPAMADVLMLFMVRQFFITLPKDLDEAALIDGCGHLQIYVRIVLPLAVPVILTLILFTFIWTWNDYTNPSIFISSQAKQLLTVGLTYVSNTERGVIITRALAGAVLAIAPIIALFALFQKYFVQGVAMTGIKG